MIGKWVTSWLMENISRRLGQKPDYVADMHEVLFCVFPLPEIYLSHAYQKAEMLFIFLLFPCLACLNLIVFRN